MNAGSRFSRNAATPSCRRRCEVWNIASESARCASSGMRHGAVAVEQLLGQAERDGGAADDERAGQLERGGQQVVGLVHRPDQPAGEGLLGGEDLGGVDPLQRLLDARRSAAGTSVDAASGTMPSRPKTKPIRALVEASRMSIASVIVAPMPTAGPLIAAITGLGQSWIASVTLPPVSRTPSWYGASA